MFLQEKEKCFSVIVRQIIAITDQPNGTSGFKFPCFFPEKNIIFAEISRITYFPDKGFFFFFDKLFGTLFQNYGGICILQNVVPDETVRCRIGYVQGNKFSKTVLVGKNMSSIVFVHQLNLIYGCLGVKSKVTNKPLADHDQMVQTVQLFRMFC